MGHTKFILSVRCLSFFVSCLCVCVSVSLCVCVSHKICCDRPVSVRCPVMPHITTYGVQMDRKWTGSGLEMTRSGPEVGQKCNPPIFILIFYFKGCIIIVRSNNLTNKSWNSIVKRILHSWIGVKTPCTDQSITIPSGTEDNTIHKVVSWVLPRLVNRQVSFVFCK